MRATRYRLRFITGVTLTSATYGSGAFGDVTYGMQASDALTALRYIAVPYPGGFLSDPSWIYRQGDVKPDLRVGILADDGFLSLAGIDTAELVLTNTDGASDITPLLYSLEVVTIDAQPWLRRIWAANDLFMPGTFRAAIVLTYTSGRRLTAPADDRHNFVITPNSTFGALPISARARWDQSLWSGADWSEVP